MFRFRLLNGRKNNQISVLTLRFFDSPVAHKGNRTTVDSHFGDKVPANLFHRASLARDPHLQSLFARP